MIINLKLTIDYNPETGACTVVKTEQAQPKVVVNNDTAEPQIVLDANKYILNQAAANLMGVKWEDRLEIKYQKVQGVIYPVIGTDISFGTPGSGNKLTKGLTVSCRGKANEMLARYGKVFTVSEMKGTDNLFVLIGDTPQVEEVLDEIEVKEDDEDIIDLPLDTEIEDAEKIDELAFTLD